MRNWQREDGEMLCAGGSHSVHSMKKRITSAMSALRTSLCRREASEQPMSQESRACWHMERPMVGRMKLGKRASPKGAGELAR